MLFFIIVGGVVAVISAFVFMELGLGDTMRHIALYEGTGASCSNCKNRRNGNCTDGSFNYSGFDDARRGSSQKVRGSSGICEYYST